jgi:L-asparaginase
MLLLHGGAGTMDPKSPDALKRATAALRRVGTAGIAALAAGREPLDVVVDCLKGMELDELFNAGRGSALQADGQARLTAALMDGSRQAFSGVISAHYILHPSVLARHLQEAEARVLTAPGTELLARKLGLPIEGAMTEKSLKRWNERLENGESWCDTVGCLVRAADGRLAVGTSTGGRGFEFPGRVSDSATVAGTYCTSYAGISATGHGEEIVDDAVAARLEARRRDGMSLKAASARALAEATERRRAYGWIAHDQDGHWAVAHTTPSMSFVVYGAEAGEVAAAVSD